MFIQFSTPIPVITPLGDGYAIYARDGGTFENDIWTVALTEGGDVRHFRTDQVQMYQNATFDIEQRKNPPSPLTTGI